MYAALSMDAAALLGNADLVALVVVIPNLQMVAPHFDAAYTDLPACLQQGGAAARIV